MCADGGLKEFRVCKRLRERFVDATGGVPSFPAESPVKGLYSGGFFRLGAMSTVAKVAGRRARLFLTARRKSIW